MTRVAVLHTSNRPLTTLARIRERHVAVCVHTTSRVRSRTHVRLVHFYDWEALGWLP